MTEAPIRLAKTDDIPAIENLIDASVRTLQAGDYSPEQIERALTLVFGVDRRLIEDGTYFVTTEGKTLTACGGWSFRRTLFGADAIHGRDDTKLLPGEEPAKIRAFFVVPAWARRGLGSQILRACEAAAAERGFTALELGATVTGVPLYARHGYRAVEQLETPLADGHVMPVVRMYKTLSPRCG